MIYCFSDMAECCNKVPVTLEDGRVIYVPCGKCANCLEHKQNEFLVKSYRAALYYGKLWLVTLSYSDESLPISASFAVYDSEGICESVSQPEYVDDLREVFFERAPIGQYTDSRSRVRTFRKAFWLPVEREDGYTCKAYLSPSVRKKDVSNWIKKCRVYYERMYGTSMPEFKYVIAPEYGSVTGRPHYHVCIYGLNAKIIYWMCAFWRKRFGFFDVRRVRHINSDGSDGFAKMSAYVSKYISKGLFERKDVKEGLCFRPRLTPSRYLGLENSSYFASLRSWHLAYDVAKTNYVVEYPICNPRTYIDYSTGEQLRLVTPAKESVDLITRIVDRLYIDINGYKYPIPKTFRSLIFLSYDRVKKRYAESELSRAIGDFLQAKSTETLLQELEAFKVKLGREPEPGEVSKFTNDFLRGRTNDSNRARERIKRFYMREKLR